MSLDPNPRKHQAPDRTLLKVPGPRECLVVPPTGDLQCIRQPTDQQKPISPPNP
jgi:hypothetical protein